MSTENLANTSCGIPATMDLFEMADVVCDRQSFFGFVRALAEDKEDEEEKERLNPSSPYVPGAIGWENGLIWTYLERSIAWAEDNIQDPAIQSEERSWNLFTRILHVGKYYE